MSKKLKEFLDKVDALCFEYGYQIYPTINGFTHKINEDGEYETIAIIGNDESIKIIGLDGDGVNLE